MIREIKLALDSSHLYTSAVIHHIQISECHSCPIRIKYSSKRRIKMDTLLGWISELCDFYMHFHVSAPFPRLINGFLSKAEIGNLIRALFIDNRWLRTEAIGCVTAVRVNLFKWSEWPLRVLDNTTLTERLFQCGACRGGLIVSDSLWTCSLTSEISLCFPQ